MIKILFLAANPQDTQRLQLDEEVRAIDQALRLAEYRDFFDMRQHWAVRYTDLQELLLRHRPNIVHFGGHGSDSGEIMVQDETGKMHPVSTESLSRLFALLTDSIQCVVLNACYSEQQAQSIAQHVDCVVGMSRAISDEAALGFAAGFYSALAYECSVGEAFELACNRIDLANLPEQNVPKLLTRDREFADLLLVGRPIETGTDEPTPGEPPYKGLDYYRQEDADNFFGRDRLTAELVSYLRDHRFLAIVGASGSGKSSLVHAGLLPALRQEQPLIDGTQPPTGSGHWTQIVIKPTAHPITCLAVELTRHAESVTATTTLIDDMARDPRSLHLSAYRLLSEISASDRLLLVVDQFEELFTLCRDMAERQAFVDNLMTAAAEDGVTTVIIALRADFYAYCGEFKQLRNVLANSQVYIGPMSEEELRCAIEEPARLGGWEFEPGLADQLLYEAGDEPGRLALLSHVLTETWNRRRGRTLTFAGYQAAGRVQGAIAHTAETVYVNLENDQQRAIARHIFLQLTELGEGVPQTRRPATLQELLPHGSDAAIVKAVLNMLVVNRLVTTDDGQAELAHEALIVAWPRLGKWIEEDHQALLVQRRITQAVKEWEDHQRDDSYLYREAQIVEVIRWSADQNLPIKEQEFLKKKPQKTVAKPNSHCSKSNDCGSDCRITNDSCSAAWLHK